MAGNRLNKTPSNRNSRSVSQFILIVYKKCLPAQAAFSSNMRNSSCNLTSIVTEQKACDAFIIQVQRYFRPLMLRELTWPVLFHAVSKALIASILCNCRKTEPNYFSVFSPLCAIVRDARLVGGYAYVSLMRI